MKLYNPKLGKTVEDVTPLLASILTLKGWVEVKEVLPTEEVTLQLLEPVQESEPELLEPETLYHKPEPELQPVKSAKTKNKKGKVK